MAQRVRKRSWKSKLKQDWNQFKAKPAGQRFILSYRTKHRGKGIRPGAVVSIFVGFLLMVAGGIMLVIPGPGIPVLVGGAVLIAREVKPAAKAMDWIEMRLRTLVKWALREWKRSTIAVRGLMVGGVLLGAGFIASVAVRVVLG